MKRIRIIAVSNNNKGDDIEMKTFEIFISGYAKLPSGTTAEELYKVVAVGIIADKYTGTIIDADCSLVTSVAREHVKKLLVGKDLNDFPALEKSISEAYFGSAKKALITSVKKCHEKFKQIIENKVIEE